MNIIIEGLDNTGKTTQIDLIKQYCKKNKIKCSTIKCSAINDKKLSMIYYKSLLEIMAKNKKENNHWLLFDRAHLGEFVYSNKYRGYSGDYVFNLEMNVIDELNESTILFVFIDNVDTLISREDNLSLSNTENQKQNIQDEIKLFTNAFYSTNLKCKFLIEVNKSFNNKINLLNNEIIDKIILKSK